MPSLKLVIVLHFLEKKNVWSNTDI